MFSLRWEGVDVDGFTVPGVGGNPARLAGFRSNRFFRTGAAMTSGSPLEDT